MKKIIIGIIGLIVIVLLGVIIFGGEDKIQQNVNQEQQENLDNTLNELDEQLEIDTENDLYLGPPITEESEENSGWKSIVLTDVLTDTTYSISELSDKPVLVESFAVWCPKCTSQQREIKKLHADTSFGDSFYSIALNTDQNEDALKVKNHAESNGFDWRYSVASQEMTNLLVDEFGLGIASAPSVPVVLVCPGNQEAHLLKSGVKKSAELKSLIESTC
jgi:thiol-disulfide isomerase/thioredoxin